jgi:hypothetical protein
VVWRALFPIVTASLMLVAGVADAAKPQADWDGLTQVKSKRFKLVYLRPGADFRGYTKVMIQPTEVAFHKDWARDYNRGSRSLSSRVSDRDVQDAVKRGVLAANDIFAEAWSKGGYAIATTPAPDVVSVKTGILDIRVTAPDIRSAARSYSFANEAGSATFFVEVRDSMTGELLGRAVDQRLAGDNSTAWRTSVSNQGDFRNLVRDWATASVRGMAELKSLSGNAPAR